VVRYNRPANGSAADKQILPFSFCEGPGGRREWRCKALPEPRPLFRLPELAARPDVPVLVVEGEKVVDAGAERFPDYVVTTSSGGSNAARKADWTPLAGRHVTIWPDADAPGARYATDVVDMLRKAGAASVRVVRLPPALLDGWDLADELRTGLTDADLVPLG
jgi:DNA primase